MNDFWLIAVDSSLKRPGFAVFHMIDSKIDSLHLTNVNNKTKKKTHGQIIDQILFHIEHVVLPRCKGEKVFVRQHVAPNHFQENAVIEVVGMLNWMLYKQNIQQKEWVEFYPSTVKATIAGSGKAKKDDVAKNLKAYVGDLQYACDDESDAVAVGLTYLIKNNIIEQRKDKKKDGNDGKEDE